MKTNTTLLKNSLSELLSYLFKTGNASTGPGSFQGVQLSPVYVKNSGVWYKQECK